MSTDNPDTNSRSSESPSSRPMTLRQQLAEIITPSAYGFDQYHDSSCPECMFDFKEARDAIEALCQEIAREAAWVAETQFSSNVWVNFKHELTKRDLSSDKMPKGYRKMSDQELLAKVLSELTQKPPQSNKEAKHE